MWLNGLIWIGLLSVLIYSAFNLVMLRRQRDRTEVDWTLELESPGNLSSLGRQLQSLQWSGEPWLFIAALVLLSLTVGLLFLELFPDRWLMASMAGSALFLFALFLLKDITQRKSRRFETRLTHVIDLMLVSLQGGGVPLQALACAARASKGETARELQFMVTQLELGMPIESATQRVLLLFPSQSVRLFVQVLRISWNAGGSPGELLRSVNRIIRDRIKFRLKLAGQLAGIRYSTVFVAVIPYLVIPFFLWKYPVWLELLSGHPLGPMLMLGAVLLQVLGFFLLRHILRTES